MTGLPDLLPTEDFDEAAADAVRDILRNRPIKQKRILLDNPQHQGVFNAGFENLSVMDIAAAVAREVPAEIQVLPSDDPRSYLVCSDRLTATGFAPKKWWAPRSARWRRRTAPAG